MRRAVIALITLVALWATAASSSAAPIGAFTTRGAFSFVSAPGLHPPKLSTDARTQSRALAPGYFLAANFPNLAAGVPLVGQSGPLMLDRNLQPVWFHPVPTSMVAMDLKPQTYNGRPALSWWQGVLNRFGAATSGQLVVVDQHYRTIATLSGQNGWVISPHDAVISGHDVWVTAYKNLPGQNFKAEHGTTNGTLYDAAVQEYDLTTGKLLFNWDAFNPGGTPNVPLSLSYQSPPKKGDTTPWDAYHVNTIELVGSSEFLVSMRDTWAAYLVDIQTGQIVWTLGGKSSTFKLAPAARFEWQHTVELLPGNVVSIFDDHCCGLVNGQLQQATGPSRGLVLQLDMTKHTASFVAEYRHNPDLDAAFTGSTQLLGDGNVVVGWGSLPWFSEFTKSGKLLLDAHWPGPDQSYRVLKSTWVGLPGGRPSGAVRKRSGKTIIYASWNGATQVTKWRVLAGNTTGRLRAVATSGRHGFETAIALKRAYKHYEVQALAANGKVLGMSNVFPKAADPGPPSFY